MMESILDGAAKTQDQRIAMVRFNFHPSAISDPDCQRFLNFKQIIKV